MLDTVAFANLLLVYRCGGSVGFVGYFLSELTDFPFQFCGR